jgi:hypothetical protein
MDFTLTAYKNLLQSLKSAGYTFVTFHNYLTSINQSSPRAESRGNQSTPTNQPQPATQNKEQGTKNPQPTTQNKEQGTRNQQPATLNPQRLVILRHDVDLKPQNSLVTAQIEHEMGIRGSYYFRMVPESFNVDIIKEIANLGHEIGYHYETMDTAERKHNSQPATLNSEELTINQSPDDNRDNHSINESHLRNESLIDAAYTQFCQNLEVIRRVADIKTICMHGSPRSKYDNRDIWKKYSYRDLGIVGEPYFDIDFNDFFYLTDTGRCWNGHRFSVRDKMPQQQRWDREGLTFRATNDIIDAAKANRLPSRIMITVHPQRWNSSMVEWVNEFILQNLKNIVKAIMVAKTQRLKG